MAIQKKPNGKYRADFRDREGRRRYKVFDTRRAADEWWSEQKRLRARGEYIAPETIPTFREAADEWLKEKVNHHPASIAGWRIHLYRHIVPRIGHLKLDRISVAGIEALRDDLLAGKVVADSGEGSKKVFPGLRPQTVSSIMTTLAAVFKLALRRGYVMANPAAIAQRPRRAVRELSAGDEEPERRGHGLKPVGPDEILGPDEITLMLAHADPGLHRTLLATVAGAGLRSEEVHALMWPDLQFYAAGGGKLFVRRSLSWSRVQGEDGPVRPKFFNPKTAAGRRSIPISPQLAKMLKIWKLQSPPSEYDLVFCRDDGKPLLRSKVLRQGLYPALSRAKLKRVNLKSLRHSFASMLIAKGDARVTEVAALLGHSDPSVTLRVYAHWFKDADSGAVDKVADGFLNGVTDATQIESVH